MKITITTPEEVINSETNGYNPAEWIKKVEMYLKYKPTFYKSEDNNFYVCYNTGGVNFFKEITYHSSLSNTGFARIDFDQYLSNGMKESDNIKHFIEHGHFIIDPNSTIDSFEVTFGLFSHATHGLIRIPNTNEGHKIMKEKSKRGVVFTQMG